MRTRRPVLILTGLVVLLAVVAIAVLTIAMRRDRDRALAEMHAQVVALGHESLFLQALDPVLAGKLDATIDVDRSPRPKTEAMLAFEGLIATYNQRSATEVWADAMELYRWTPVEDWSTSDWMLAAEFVESQPDVLADIASLARVGGPVWPIERPIHVDVELPHLGLCRELARLLSMQTYVQSHAGLVQEALESVKTTILLGQAAGADNLVISRIVEIALKGMGEDGLKYAALPGSLSAEQTADIAAFIEASLPEDPCTEPLVIETAMFLNALEDMRNGANMLGGWFGLLQGSVPWRPMLYTDETAFLGTMARLTAISRMPYPKARPLLDEWSACLDEGNRFHHTFTRTVTPALTHLPTAVCRNATAFELARTGLTLELRRAEDGVLTSTLEDIAQDLGGSVPSDPFTGRPFIYRPDGDSFLLYSLADNQVDDGGIHDWKEGDYVWRGRSADCKSRPRLQASSTPLQLSSPQKPSDFASMPCQISPVSRTVDAATLAHLSAPKEPPP